LNTWLVMAGSVVKLLFRSAKFGSVNKRRRGGSVNVAVWGRLASGCSMAWACIWVSSWWLRIPTTIRKKTEEKMSYIQQPKDEVHRKQGVKKITGCPTSCRFGIAELA
jgi:hypothetical protein